MKPILTSAVLLLVTFFGNAQAIYTRAFGSAGNKSIVFLHGGPGYNCANFEATTAQPLADKGFYVIVYDRRGEGRSKDPQAQFTFYEALSDLQLVYQKYGLTKATLIGHSFGGIVAARFAEKYPEQVQSIILTGAPVSLQETFKTIITASKILYQTKKDSVSLKYIAMLENMDKSSIEYSSYSFMHAMQNGFYSPKNPTDEAKKIYSTFRTDTLLMKYAAQMDYQAAQGFWKNEKYTTLDLTPDLKKLQSKRIPLYGLYGKDDGLYSAAQVAQLQRLFGEVNVNYIERCSHNVFIDQQSKFTDAVVLWAK